MRSEVMLLLHVLFGLFGDHFTNDFLPASHESHHQHLRQASIVAVIFSVAESERALP